jgi:toxin FitB
VIPRIRAIKVISELRSRKPHGAVLAWLETVSEGDLPISAVTLGEIQAGIELTREQDARKAEEIESWLEQITLGFGILDMHGATFRTWAKMMHGKSNIISEDLMIAATAKTHKLTIVTRNTADFKSLGVALLNPFKFSPN